MFFLWNLLLITLEMFSLIVFFETFGEKRRKKWKHDVWVMGILLVVPSYVIAFLLVEHFIVKQIVFILLYLFSMYFYMEIGFLKVTALSVMFQGLLVTVDYFNLTLIKVLFDRELLSASSHTLANILIMILGKIILFLIILFINKIFSKAPSEMMTGTEWIRFIIFPIFSIAVITAMGLTFQSVENKRQLMVITSIAFGVAGLNIIVFFLIKDILNRELKIRESEMFKLKMKNQTESFYSISENYEKQKTMTHEFMNQIICIQAMLKNGQYHKLEEYVAEIGGNMNKELDRIDTNHVIVNAIISSKYEEALEKNIIFVIKVNDLSNIRVSDEDIVIILSNLLNNALEASQKCENDRIVRLKFIKEKDNIFLSVINTYASQPHVEEGKFLSSKEHNEMHGIGMGNIIDTIEKYSGSYVIKYDKGEFTFSIRIPQGTA